MRTIAALAVVFIAVALPISLIVPFAFILLWPMIGIAAIPVVLYVLFTLPEERAERERAAARSTN